MTTKSIKRFALGLGAITMASLLTQGCGDASQSNDSDAKIYGGSPTGRGQFNSAVAITNKYAGVFCSGTVISPTVVITAAHCLGMMGNPSDNYIYVGSGEESGLFLGQFQVKSAKASPSYSYSGNDIAYITLAQPIPSSRSGLVPVLTKRSEIAEIVRHGKTVRVIGFGNRNNGSMGVKYQVDAPITSVGSNEIGIGGGGKDSCQGDSGGPVYGQLPNGEWRVFGVVSRGGACGQGGIYGLMHANICWVQRDSGINLGLPAGTCDGRTAAVSRSRPE